MTWTVAAIDLGASSGRVLIGTLSADGVLTVDECSRFPNAPVRVPFDSGDDLQWDVLSLWEGIRAGLREAARRGPVDAVGIDTWGVDYGLLDADGRLLGNPMSYRSERTATAVERVHSALPPEELYALNGIQFQPFNTMFQLVADTCLARDALTRQMLLIPDLLGYWLTGQRICEVSNASTTGLIDPATRRWSPRILTTLREGLHADVPAILPPLVEPGTVVGPVHLGSVDLRTHTGAPSPLIAVASHDTASAVVAVPATHDHSDPGATFGFISSGTWSLVGVELDAPVRTPASRRANFTNELGLDGTVRYLKNITGMWVQQECLRQWRDEDAGRQMPWPEVTAETEAATPMRTLFDVNDPVFAAPGVMTTRIDEWAERAGEPIPRHRGEYLRSITESLVVAYRRALREATRLSGSAIGAVHVVGGGSKNRLLCQLTADATGLPVVAGPVEGTAVGNMLVQLRAIGALRGGLDALRLVVERSVETDHYAPTPGAEVLWDEAERRVLNPRRTPAAAVVDGLGS
ncbi:rhamnulokinase family protein [Brooklawnia cerclae]|uniref:Rhamnulokinase n=1 Tax=Brooklawnia cerclae TaxID=349934 RepID=A0ABX0SPY1_9ACTN|nr:rhamnulokinase family protein [Brooklawnia cerclae]NIH58791.1 rhamnulokinase [Brooklawnia cerclae]